MKRAFVDALEIRRSVIKHQWEAALRRVPVPTPLANPDTLIFMMDATLNKLFALARSRSIHQWISKHPLTGYGVGRNCRCGLNPFVAYFLAGESALVSISRAIRPHHGLTENDILISEAELLFALRVLGHREINAFCEVCRVAASTKENLHQHNCPSHACTT
ncbi:MAG: hypothetical protein ABSE59_10220 [Opitutaceae bacterium]|jgi:hypothetical protein